MAGSVPVGVGDIGEEGTRLSAESRELKTETFAGAIAAGEGGQEGRLTMFNGGFHYSEGPAPSTASLLAWEGLVALLLGTAASKR